MSIPVSGLFSGRSGWIYAKLPNRLDLSDIRIWFSRICSVLSKVGSTYVTPVWRKFWIFECSLAKHLSFCIIKVYISAVQFYLIANRDQSRISNMAHLSYVFRGIKLFFGSSMSRLRRLFIIIRQLHILFSAFSRRDLSVTYSLLHQLSLIYSDQMNTPLHRPREERTLTLVGEIPQ